jgi:hypothetical protein
MKPTRSLLCAALLAANTAMAAAEDCGTYVKHDPGGDYTNPADREGLVVVEQYHFTPEVERLVHQVVHGRAADAQHLGGLDDIAVDPRQRLDDAPCTRPRRAPGAGSAALLPVRQFRQAQVVGDDGVRAVGHDDGALDAVFHLAHIARPLA